MHVLRCLLLLPLSAQNKTEALDMCSFIFKKFRLLVYGANLVSGPRTHWMVSLGILLTAAEQSWHTRCAYMYTQIGKYARSANNHKAQ